MSLINQMLKDIDKRQGHSALASSGVPLPTMRGRSGLSAKSLSLVGVLLVAGVAGGYGWLHSGPTKPAEALVQPVAVVPAPTEPVAAVDKAPAIQEPEMPQASEREVTKAEPPAKKMALKSVQEKAQVPVATTAPMDKPAQPALPAGQVTRTLSAEQRADNAYRDAVTLLRQGRGVDAQKSLQQALLDQPVHQSARLLLAQLLHGDGHFDQAKALLSEGVALRPQAFAMHESLAQMQLMDRDAGQAVATLERGLAAAGDNAAYHALLATALQQQARHDQAVQHYVIALRQQPDVSNWLVGLGISLQAQGQMQGAAEAYQRALDLGLPASLSQFTRERLRQISR